MSYLFQQIDKLLLSMRKKPRSTLVNRVGNKLYINLCRDKPRWNCVVLDNLTTVIVTSQSLQENGYSITFAFKDDRDISLSPEDHKMGFTLAEANEIVLAV